MSPVHTKEVTELLHEWGKGNHEAMERVIPLVYEHLRRLASHYMRRERAEHTLQPTALVNEAYLRLNEIKVSWKDRAHFFAVAARLMRRLLVDHARAGQRRKRENVRISLDDATEISTTPAPVSVSGVMFGATSQGIPYFANSVPAPFFPGFGCAPGFSQSTSE